MRPIQKARRWAQNNPQLATSLLTFTFFAGVAAVSGDLASLENLESFENVDGFDGAGTTGDDTGGATTGP